MADTSQEAGKAVLITGCSTGIGRATAEHLADRGWTVYATAHRPESIEDLREKGCKTLALDVTDEASMRNAVEEVEGAEGAVGVLVNNAGYSRSGAVESVNLDDIQLPPLFYPVVVNIFLSTLGLHATQAAVLAQYPISNYQQSIGRALTAIGTDAVFACPGRRAAQSLSKYVPTYAYEFSDPNAPQIVLPPASFPYGAYHGSEIQHLFDVPNQTGAPSLNADQQTLADTMKRYWTQFARTGGPNSPGTPQWPAYTVGGDAYQSLVPPAPVTTTGFAADHKCAFWDGQ